MAWIKLWFIGRVCVCSLAPDPATDVLKTSFTGVKASAITLILFREQLNINGVGVALGVQLTSGMEFVWKRAENRRPVLGFGCYAIKGKATNRDTSASDGNWRDQSGPCLGAVGFACRRIICTDCLFLHTYTTGASHAGQQIHHVKH